MGKPNLDAIRRRASAATTGPWKVGSRFGSGSLGSSAVVLSGRLPQLELDPHRNGRADATFIAHARQDIPALLAEIDRLRAELIVERTFTHQSVLDGIAAGASWADPTMDPTTIDWPARQAAAVVPFKVVDGRPVNPCGPTGIRYGRNELGHWGEQQCADAVVTATYAGQRWILLVERDDGHGWATPGGYVDPGETVVEAARRELAEETTLVLLPTPWRPGSARVVPDPRASDEAWMVTTPVLNDLGEVEQLPKVIGADDARRAAWVAAATYDETVGALRMVDGRVFPAHEQLLREVLDGVNEWDDAAGMPAPCQPIGCDNGFHLPGCVFAEADGGDH